MLLVFVVWIALRWYAWYAESCGMGNRKISIEPEELYLDAKTVLGLNVKPKGLSGPRSSALMLRVRATREVR